MSFEKLIRIPNDRIAVLIGKSGTVKSKIEQLCFVSPDTKILKENRISFFNL